MQYYFLNNIIFYMNMNYDNNFFSKKIFILSVFNEKNSLKMMSLLVLSFYLSIHIIASFSSNKTKEEPLLFESSFVVVSQNTTITFSDDSHCNSLIKDDVLFQFSNGEFSVLTRRLSLKPNIQDFKNFRISSKFPHFYF